MFFNHVDSQITGARAWTKNDNALYTDLTTEEQKTVLNWIRMNIDRRRTPLYGRSSYGLKHILERDTKIYMTNNQFKDAMLECGFFPVDMTELNWYYCISMQSPCFTHKGGTYQEGGTV